MKADEFCRKVNSLMPSYNDLRALNLSEDFIFTFQNSYRCVKLNNDTDDNEILKFIKCYNSNVIKIGIIAFYDKIEGNDKLIYLGKVELDDLVLDLSDGVIRVLDCSTTNNILWECAISGDSFLSALTICLEFLTKRLFDDTLYNDENEAKQCALKCSNIAGENSFSFYMMILGW